jgi:glutamine synthetase
MIATFMPKPFTQLTGNGCHFHMSLWDGDTNLFLDEATRADSGCPRPPYKFIGGLQEARRGRTARSPAPTVNSYKRLKLGSTSSGATWSPVWISYGYNNRTQMLRSPGRVASRTARSTARATRTSRRRPSSRPGSTGSRRASTRASPTPENLYTISEQELRSRGLESLPANLLEAVGELERDDVLRSALGRGRDEDYLDYFARVKRDEWFRYHEQVTPWEVREYLTRF